MILFSCVIKLLHEIFYLLANPVIWGGSCTVIVEDVRKKVIRSLWRCVLPAAVCFSSLFSKWLWHIPAPSEVQLRFYLHMIIHQRLINAAKYAYGNGFCTNAHWLLLTGVNTVVFELWRNGKMITSGRGGVFLCAFKTNHVTCLSPSYPLHSPQMCALPCTTSG